MTNHLRLTALLLSTTLAACGGKSFDVDGKDPDHGGSSNQGGGSHVAGASGSGTGNVGSGATANGGAATGGSGAGGIAHGGSPSDACAGLADEVGMILPVDIVNQSSDVLYLGTTQASCGALRLFDVADAQGTLATASDCRAPCDVVRKEGPAACPDICQLPSATALQPGEAYSTNWNGLDYMPVTIPKACVVAPYGAEQCERALRIEPGTFTFSAQAGAEISCADSSASGTCEACLPGVAGGCVTWGALLTGELRSASTSVVLDGDYGIYPKAAPAPGETGGALPQFRLQIVFTD